MLRRYFGADEDRIIYKMKIRLFTIPNMFTLANLMCGSIAVISLFGCAWGGPAVAFMLVILAALFDFCDGFAARLLHCPSPIGVQLDSLADMVSFGLVPSAVFMSLWGGASQWCGCWPEWTLRAGYYVPLIIAAFSALRLAKFNVDDTQHTEFEGLPTPASALLCTSLAALSQAGYIGFTREAIVAVSILTACLLISPVRMFSLKFKGFGWRGNAVRYLFLAASLCIVAASLIFHAPAYSVMTIIVLYIVVSTLRWVFCRRGGGEQ